MLEEHKSVMEMRNPKGWHMEVLPLGKVYEKVLKEEI